MAVVVDANLLVALAVDDDQAPAVTSLLEQGPLPNGQTSATRLVLTQPFLQMVHLSPDAPFQLPEDRDVESTARVDEVGQG